MRDCQKASKFLSRGFGALTHGLGLRLRNASQRCLQGTKNAHELFLHKLFEHPKGLGHPGKSPGTFQIPLFETQGRQTFEGGHELVGHHPTLRMQDPHPPGRSPDPKS